MSSQITLCKEEDNQRGSVCSVSAVSVSQDDSLVIMGGYDDTDRKTSETVSSDGDNTRSKMKYPAW